MSSSSPSYLTKNRLGVYILQVRVPANIRHNRRLIQRSLRTRNRRDALKQARRLVIQLEDNNFDIDLIDKQFLRDAELFHIGKPLFEELQRLWSEGDQLAIDSFLVDLTSNEEEALRYLADLNNRNIDQLAQLLKIGDRRKTAEFLLELPRIFKQPIREVLNRHLATNKPSPSPTPSSAPQQPIRSTKDVKLDIAFETWKDTYQPPAMSKSAFGEYTRLIAFFLRIIKHVNHDTMPRISELNTDMIGEYKTILEKVPRGVHTKSKTIEQLTNMTGEKTAPTTIKNTFGNVGHFIQWLSNEGYPLQQANICSVLTHHRKVKKEEKKRRVPLDDKDLQVLFLSDNYRLGKWKRASEFWVPLIALFTGMARNEIVQLEVKDVYPTKGYHVIDVNERGNKQLKVASSNDDEGSTGRPRIIPIHKQLIDMGFLDFAQHQKQKGEVRLFPCEPRNNRGHFGAYGNRFRRYRDKVGAGPRHDKEYRDFHSFRHLMKTKLREVEKDDGLIDDILGHTSTLRSTVGRTYDHSERLEFKANAIKKLKHECIDFDSIRPWQRHSFARN